MTNKITISELKDPVVFLAVGFGSGLVPFAPGTAGTIMAIPLYLLLSTFELSIYLAVTLLVTIVGIWVSTYTANKFKVHDHQSIVIDEIAGFFITMAFVPNEWIWIVIGFVLFRFFDMVKPWPISWLDKNVKGGLGIMIDDVAAGFVSLFCMMLAMAYVN